MTSHLSNSTVDYVYEHSFWTFWKCMNTNLLIIHSGGEDEDKFQSSYFITLQAHSQLSWKHTHWLCLLLECIAPLEQAWRGEVNWGYLRKTVCWIAIYRESDRRKRSRKEMKTGLLHTVCLCNFFSAMSMINWKVLQRQGWE